MLDAKNKDVQPSAAMPTLARALESIRDGATPSFADIDTGQWRRALTVIRPYLKSSMPLERIERVEAVLKAYLRTILQSPMSGSGARFLAAWSRELGFILKSKPYGVKCATPLGYSIFFLHAGEGFSFQRHLTRKTEVFHILRLLDNARVFLCSSDDWAGAYEPSAFAAWLNGEPMAAFDKFSLRPDPGDVYRVAGLGTVHSVLGCVLEEFATVSTDMVDRLHDQNTGRENCALAQRPEVESWLKELPDHLPRVAGRSNGNGGTPLIPRSFDEGEAVTLSSSEDFVAERYRAAAGRSLRFAADEVRARLLFVLRGQCDAVLRGAGEAPSAPVPALALKAGDPLLVAPSVKVELQARSALSVSSHSVHPEAALA